MRNAGLRAQEAAHVKWCNITQEDGLLHVCPDSRSPWKPKKGRDRFVPMHEEALKELLSHRKSTETDDDYLLPVERPPRARSRNRIRAQRIFKRSAEWLRASQTALPKFTLQIKLTVPQEAPPKQAFPMA
jgi:integrase